MFAHSAKWGVLPKCERLSFSMRKKKMQKESHRAPRTVGD